MSLKLSLQWLDLDQIDPAQLDRLMSDQTRQALRTRIHAAEECKRARTMQEDNSNDEHV